MKKWNFDGELFNRMRNTFDDASGWKLIEAIPKIGFKEYEPPIETLDYKRCGKPYGDYIDMCPMKMKSTVVYIKINGDADYRIKGTYVYEIVRRCCCNNEAFRDFINIGNELFLIYSSPYKKDLESAHNDAAAAHSFCDVLNYFYRKSNLGKMTVDIGIDFNDIEVFNLGNGRFGFNGSAIDNAKRISSYNPNYTTISEDVRRNLSLKEAALYKPKQLSENECVYIGNVINIQMNNYILNK